MKKLGKLQIGTLGLIAIASTWALIVHFVGKKLAVTLNPDLRIEYRYYFNYASIADVPGFLKHVNGSSSYDNLEISIEGAISWLAIETNNAGTKYVFEIDPSRSNDSGRIIFPDVIAGTVFVSHHGNIDALTLPKDALQGSSLIVTELLRNFFPSLDSAGKSAWSSEFNGQKFSWTLRSFENFYIIGKTSKGGNNELEAQYSLSQKATFIESVSVVSRSKKTSFQNSDSNLSIDFKRVPTISNSGRSLLNTAQFIQEKAIIKEDISNSAFKEMQEAESLKRILGLDNSHSLTDKLKSADPKDRRANMELYGKLKALFTLYPESIRQFTSFLKDFPLDDDRFVLPATAMTAVGSRAAQESLKEALLSSELDSDRQSRLIPNLTFVERPTQETEDVIRELTIHGANDDIKRTADRGLGTIAHNIKNQSLDRALRIFQDYSEKLLLATTDETRIEQLAILGNMGMPGQYKVISKYTKDPNKNLRYQAVQALRFVESDEAIATLLDVSATDNVEKVKEGAAESIKFQSDLTDEQVSGIEKNLFASKNITVAKHLVEALANQKVAHPRAIVIIQAYWRQCGHPDLCGYVENILNGTSVPH